MEMKRTVDSKEETHFNYFLKKITMYLLAYNSLVILTEGTLNNCKNLYRH